MCIEIEKEGVFNSLQGLGNFGLQRFGINPRGAMDHAAVRLVNVLLGNAYDLSVVELHFPAGNIVFTEQCRFALGGANFAAELEGETVDNWQTCLAEAGQTLRFKKRLNGNRCYLAVSGGLTARPPGEARSANDLTTERLRTGDRVFRKVDPPSSYNETHGRRVSPSILPRYSSFPTVRFLAGGEFDLLDAKSKELLLESNFEISSDSNRMGFRLKAAELTLTTNVELVSASVNFGTMQLLPDGQLVVLMADHQTTGGYPRIGNVISADIPLIGQLGAGNKVAFALTSTDEAEHAALEFEADLRRLKIGVGFGRYW